MNPGPSLNQPLKLSRKTTAVHLNYYVKILGFEKYVETPNLGIVERDGHQIHLMRSQEEQPAHRVWIGVEDISILFNQYRKKGVKFFQEPTNFSWAYQMIVEDLDGNRLIFGSGPKLDEPFQDGQE